MASGRRRSARKTAQLSPRSSREASEPSLQSHELQRGNVESDADSNAAPNRSDDDLCPACEDKGADLGPANKEDWVRCDACKTWFHWRCVGEGGDLEIIDKWFCVPCVTANPSRTITLKPPARKSSRKRVQQDYASLHSGIQSDPNKWVHILKDKTIKMDPFKRMEGAEVCLDWLNNDETAMREPIVVDTSDGLGMKMPPTDLTVSDVAELVGPDMLVEVMDVATQSNTPGYTLSKWADYYNTEPASRDKIRNVISLEISNSKLADKITPPRLVRELDWVEKFWPSNKKGKGNVYPKVQLYCLMGVAQAWTDWHIDFAGSSVYYHIFRGSKVFYFIRPTSANLAAYERWSGTELQNHTWLGDMVDEVFKVELKEGNTMIIPTGWIHAVYTPTDSLVFGGNFLHSYNVAMQLQIRDIETATHVPKKFRFPFFSKLCWYVAEKYLRDMKAKEEFPTRVLESLEALSSFLVSEVRIMERRTDQAKREVKDQVPTDRVKDAPALARELRWRVRVAMDGTSDSEGQSWKMHKAVMNGHTSNGSKRKRVEEEIAAESERRPQFRHFQPKDWQRWETKDIENATKTTKAEKPDDADEGWAERWVGWTDDRDETEGEEVNVERKRQVTVRVRRTTAGIERQRLDRVWEVWQWPPARKGEEQ